MEKGLNEFNENEELIISFLQGNLLSGQTRDLMNWINESDSNRIFFEEVRNIWLGTSGTKGTPVNTEQDWKQFRSRINQPSIAKLYEESHRKNERLRRFYRIAALFILIFTAGYIVSWYVANNNVNKDSKNLIRNTKSSYLAS